MPPIPNFLKSILLFVVFGLASPALAEDWAPLVRQTMPSVVALRGYDQQGQQISSSTGFSIGENRIVTCWHCISSGIVRMEAIDDSGSSRNVTDVLVVSRENDLAILGSDNDYSPEIGRLLKDFYLFL